MRYTARGDVLAVNTSPGQSHIDYSLHGSMLFKGMAWEGVGDLGRTCYQTPFSMFSDLVLKHACIILKPKFLLLE